MLKSTMPIFASRQRLPVLLKAWLLCGTIDLLTATTVYCFLLHKATVLQLLQRISSAAYGPQAYQGGWYTGITGIGFHYVIAAIFTVVYFAIVPKIARIPLIARVAGYGLLVWSVMNLVVIPLSKVPSWPHFPDAVLGMLIIIVLFAGSLVWFEQRNRL